MIPDKLKIVLEFLEQDDCARDAGDLHVLPDGAIVRRDWSMPMDFTFRCFGIPVSARVSSSGSKAKMALRAVLGSVPFTAEAASARRALLAQIRSRQGMVRTDGREIRAEDTVEISPAVKPAALIAAATDFMLRLEPEISALSGSVMRPAA